MSMLKLIEKVDSSPYITDESVYLFKAHDGTILGKMIQSVVDQSSLIDWLLIEDRTVKILDPTNLDSKFSSLTSRWRDKKTFVVLEGWRSELYTCFLHDGKKYFNIERSAACLFGLVTYGCHITGYSERPDQIWVPRRSYSKPTYPGMLDNTVAGGLGDGVGFFECALKECYEEAGLRPEDTRSRLKQVGVVAYEFIDPETGYYQPEVQCVYDLSLDASTIPHPIDGEAQDFKLMNAEEVKSRMINGEFKYNCSLVSIDYFIRHGMLTIENEPDSFDIVTRSHRKSEYPLRKSE